MHATAFRSVEFLSYMRSCICCVVCKFRYTSVVFSLVKMLQNLGTRPDPRKSLLNPIRLANVPGFLDLTFVQLWANWVVSGRDEDLSVKTSTILAYDSTVSSSWWQCRWYSIMTAEQESLSVSSYLQLAVHRLRRRYRDTSSGCPRHRHWLIMINAYNGVLYCTQTWLGCSGK